MESDCCKSLGSLVMLLRQLSELRDHLDHSSADAPNVPSVVQQTTEVLCNILGCGLELGDDADLVQVEQGNNLWGISRLGLDLRKLDFRTYSS